MNKNIRVGTFFLISLSILLFALYWGKGLFDSFSEKPLFITFDDVSGLHKGDPVTFRGVKVGRVQSIHVYNLMPLVEVSIDKDVLIYNGSHALLQTTELLGGKHINIIVESGGTITDTIPGFYQMSINDLSKTIGPTIQSIKTFMDTLQDIRGDLYGVLMNLDQISSSLQQFTDEFNAVNKNDASGESFTEHIYQVVLNLDSLLWSLRQGEGTAGKLITSDSLYNRLYQSVELLEDVMSDFKSNPSKYLRELNIDINLLERRQKK